MKHPEVNQTKVRKRQYDADDASQPEDDDGRSRARQCIEHVVQLGFHATSVAASESGSDSDKRDESMSSTHSIIRSTASATQNGSVPCTISSNDEAIVRRNNFKTVRFAADTIFVFDNGMPSAPLITVGQNNPLRTVFQGPEWNTQFIPTLLKYLGSCEEPCSWIDPHLVLMQAPMIVADLQVIWDAVYGDRIRWTVRRGDEVFNMLLQDITRRVFRHGLPTWQLIKDGHILFAKPHCHAPKVYHAAMLWCLRKINYDESGNPIIVRMVDPHSCEEGPHEVTYALIDFKSKAAQCSRSACCLSVRQIARIKKEMTRYERIYGTLFNAWSPRDESPPDEDLSSLVDLDESDDCDSDDSAKDDE
ncbi:hypothetical protein C8Q80DRAFT_1117223 [Daedaleopsis nitida]|nr:hypothetical protein C8Q80DRAFT_1117223 [Daedaleopsis nitida]